MRLSLDVVAEGLDTPEEFRTASFCVPLNGFSDMLQRVVLVDVA